MTAMLVLGVISSASADDPNWGSWNNVFKHDNVGVDIRRCDGPTETYRCQGRHWRVLSGVQWHDRKFDLDVEEAHSQGNRGGGYLYRYIPGHDGLTTSYHPNPGDAFGNEIEAIAPGLTHSNWFHGGGYVQRAGGHRPYDGVNDVSMWIYHYGRGQNSYGSYLGINYADVPARGLACYTGGRDACITVDSDTQQGDFSNTLAEAIGSASLLAGKFRDRITAQEIDSILNTTKYQDTRRINLSRALSPIGGLQ